MNRIDLEASVAEKAGVDRKVVKDVISATLDTITDTLRRGEPVRIVNFATFMVQERQARKGKNPKTGEEITIDAYRKVSLKAGKHLKNAVNQG